MIIPLSPILPNNSKMEDSKYYTPTIDEFHVGFEFEVKYEKEGWSKEVFGEGEKAIHSLPQLCVGVLNCTGFEGYVRVKHLDRDDIESFGGSYDNNSEPNPPRKEGYDPCTAFQFDDGASDLRKLKQWILYWYPDGTVWIEYIEGWAGHGYVFKGVVPNKSELKRILKQTGVLK